MDMTAANIYGTAPTFIGSVPAQTAMDATDSIGSGGWKSLTKPSNPVFWFGVVLLVTVGAAGLAGSVRLGPASIKANIGKA